MRRRSEKMDLKTMVQLREYLYNFLTEHFGKSDVYYQAFTTDTGGHEVVRITIGGREIGYTHVDIDDKVLPELLTIDIKTYVTRSLIKSLRTFDPVKSYDQWEYEMVELGDWSKIELREALNKEVKYFNDLANTFESKLI